MRALALALTLAGCLLFGSAVGVSWAGPLEAFLEQVLADRLAYVLPVTALGLANRLRIVAGFHAVATLEKRSLIVIWHPSPDCDAAFHELFEFDESDASLLVHSLPRTEHTSLSELELLIAQSVRRVAPEAGELYPRDFLFQQSHSIPQPRVHLVWTRAMHAPQAPSCQEMMSLKSNFYLSLRPVPQVSAIVARTRQVLQTRAPSMVVGVHIRAFDARYDWAVVPPAPFPANDFVAAAAAPTDLDGQTLSATASSRNLAQRFDQASPLEAFVALMASLERPGLVFFVSSNSPIVGHELRKRFGDAIVTSQPDSSGPSIEGSNTDDSVSSNRSSLAGVRLALADFLLLGDSSAYLLHSRASSFAAEAAAVRGIKLLDVTTTGTDGNNVIAILGQDPSLPLCGSPEYHRALLPPSGRRFCYQELHEIPESSRKMCTSLVLICRCPMLNHNLSFMLPPIAEPRLDHPLPVYCPASFEHPGQGQEEACLLLPAEGNGHSIEYSYNF